MLRARAARRRVEDLAKGPAAEADSGAPQFAAWWRILNRATDPVPARRYQSAKALLKDVRRLHLKVSVSPVKKTVRTAGLWLLVLTLMFLVAYAVFSIVRERRVTAETRASVDAGVAAAQAALKDMEKENEERKKELEDLKKAQDAEKKRREAMVEQGKKDALEAIKSSASDLDEILGELDAMEKGSGQ